MKNAERGYALIMVLIFLGVGALVIVPALKFAFSSDQGKLVHTGILKDQYARDGAVEYGVWQLQYGDATTLLNDPVDCPGSICTYEVALNGITTDLTLRMLTELGTLGVAGAEDNKVRSIVSVKCDEDGSGDYGDDCSSLPKQSGMLARYTVALSQLSPDTSSDLEYLYAEIGSLLDYKTGTVDSPDSSFTEILSVTPENKGSPTNEIWEWDFSSAPISFEQDEVKTFRFEVDIPNRDDRWCIGVFLMLDGSPNEKSDKRDAQVIAGSPPDGCEGGGMLSEKFVDQLVAPPSVTTVFTYIANIENFENNTLTLDSIKDVLPQGGFEWCDPADPPPDHTCDAAMYKIVDDPFDPDVDSFTDTTGFSALADPTETYNADNRWELLWDDGWSMAQAGSAGDTFILRFQAHVTPTESGSYYNELFADVDCSAPNPLITAGATTASEYCSSYSWPTGGTLVPMYDVNSASDRTFGQGNVTVGIGGTTLESWHVEDN